ncbi:hypothetical protein Pla108_02240 [Botrimarina colliarenosi]|uniref:PEP-CTERM protein-sorting domain-containing protein n=1 Tax=Botrimarina colliarenosi TaxID=2528001 RepID=A0A5C6AI29_9BACT|nr:hypothetical protein [Botrimarina colliarenosi]TWT99289.1 hypothetical protein Pla108_02240 [Botrimarina colliarenosi]
MNKLLPLSILLAISTQQAVADYVLRENNYNVARYNDEGDLVHRYGGYDARYVNPEGTALLPNFFGIVGLVPIDNVFAPILGPDGAVYVTTQQFAARDVYRFDLETGLEIGLKGLQPVGGPYPYLRSPQEPVAGLAGLAELSVIPGPGFGDAGSAAYLSTSYLFTGFFSPFAFGDDGYGYAIATFKQAEFMSATLTGKASPSVSVSSDTEVVFPVRFSVDGTPANPGLLTAEQLASIRPEDRYSINFGAQVVRPASLMGFELAPPPGGNGEGSSAFAPDGAFLYSNGDTLQRLTITETPTGPTYTAEELLTDVGAFVFGPDGRIYFEQNNQISVYDYGQSGAIELLIDLNPFAPLEFAGHSNPLIRDSLGVAPFFDNSGHLLVPVTDFDPTNPARRSQLLEFDATTGAFVRVAVDVAGGPFGGGFYVPVPEPATGGTLLVLLAALAMGRVTHRR